MANPVTSPATCKGYLIAELTVTDPELFKQYVVAAAKVLSQFGGTYLVRGGQALAKEGSAPGERVVIVEFDSFATARAFYESAAYQAIVAMRTQSTDGRVFLIEGASLGR